MTSPLDDQELYVSVDVETAGPNPSQYSLLSIGACSVFHPEHTFYIELKPVNPSFQEGSLASTNFSLEELSVSGVEPKEAMQRFANWLKQVVPPPAQPLFVGFNAPFDWMFVNDYFHRFLGRNPFGHAAIDIKSYYLGLSGLSWKETTMKFIGPLFINQPSLVHHALRDALDQGEIFRNFLLESAMKL
jgi:DNA polymerase III epsilon subunit-like protein